MPGDIEYDVFLSHANEDSEWCEKLAQRLRDEGVRVWFDKWELQPGDHLLARLNDGIEKSRKMIAVWTASYFRDKRVWTLAESYSEQHTDVLAEQRPLIPLLREDCKIPPTLRNILYVDCRNDADFDLRLRELVQALDMRHRDIRSSEDLLEGQAYDLAAETGHFAVKTRKRLEDDVATLYRLLGFDVQQGVRFNGFRVDLMIQQKQGGLLIQAIIECKDRRISTEDGNRILAKQRLAQKIRPKIRWLAVSSQGFTTDARTSLTDADVACTTYAELLRELVPLDHYVEGLMSEYETWVGERWNGQDWFIRPDLLTDITFEKKPALEHIGKWLGDSRGNLMVVLGDLGAGKSTLASFLAYNLAKAFCHDPIRQPAPVLIPLKDVRKENSLESIIISHFASHGLQDINFRRFIHLVRLGKIVLFFDAFDEMADRVRSEVTQSNFRELKRAAEHNGKVILTCRTHYFKDRNEQVTVIGEGPKLSEIETDLYRELRQQSSAEVVYLQEFDDEKILGYLAKARPGPVDEDWKKIQEIHNLKDLAQRPLLLDMIVKSLALLDKGQPVNAANLYTVYTNIWVDREEEKGRFLDKRIKLALMIELASQMWNEGKPAIHYHDLLPFLKRTAPEKMARAGEEELLDIAREIQGASFLKRMDDEGNFSFMHRSFMEFFLARSFFQRLVESQAATGIRAAAGSEINEDLLRLIREAGILDVLDTNRLDRKVIYFLTLLDAEDQISTPLQRILTSGYVARVSENALQILYWSKRIQLGMEDKIPDAVRLRQGMVGRIPSGAVLREAQLQEIVLEGADLSNAIFDGADLTGAKFNHAHLSGCSFFRARLEAARLDGAKISAVSFCDANLLDASFDDASIERADFTGAYGERIGLVGSLGEQVKRVAAATLEYRRDHLSAIVQSGHASEVFAVDFSPDGELIASAGGDGVILIYRRADGWLLRTLEGHTSTVWSVTFSPDGESLASGSADNRVMLWETKTGRAIRVLEGHTGQVTSVAFSPDGESLASGSYDNRVRLWEVKTGRAIRALEGHAGTVWAVAFSSDGESLVSGSDDTTIKLWEVKTGRALRALNGHMGAVFSVAFSPDGERLASGSTDQSVRFWEVKTGRGLRALEGHTNWVRSVAFSLDGESLASGSMDTTVRLWEVRTGRALRALEGHTYGVTSVEFSPDGENVASGSYDTSVRLWEVGTGRALRALEGHTNWLWSVAFSPDGERLASGGNDKTIRLWEVKTGAALRALEGHTTGRTSVVYSPDGENVASGSSDTSIRLWDVKSGLVHRTLEGHTEAVSSLAFSPDGQSLASGSYDQSVRLWEVNTGRVLQALQGHANVVMSVAFSPDGETIASASYDTSVRLWDVRSGYLVRTLKGRTNLVNSLAFSPTEGTLATGSDDGFVRLWDVTTGRALRQFWGQRWVNCVEFSPDGQSLASGNSDHSVTVWEMGTGREVWRMSGNLGAVYSVAFAPNGKYLIAAGAAGRLQFLDIENGETFLYRYVFGPGEWLDLMPDGRFNASPEGMRYLSYTDYFAEGNSVSCFTAESLAKEFYDPQAVKDVLDRYTSAPPIR